MADLVDRARAAVTDRAELPGMSLMEHLDELRKRLIRSVPQASISDPRQIPSFRALNSALDSIGAGGRKRSKAALLIQKSIACGD